MRLESTGWSRLPSVLLLTIVIWGLLSPPAKAALRFCNNTQNLIEASLGYHDSKDWVAEGWWRIEPNQCTRVGHFKTHKPLPKVFYYYALTVQTQLKSKGPVIWGGKNHFCTRPEKAFRTKGNSDCEKKGYKMTGFQAVSIGNSSHGYTLNFDDKENTKPTHHH